MHGKKDLDKKFIASNDAKILAVPVDEETISSLPDADMWTPAYETAAVLAARNTPVDTIMSETRLSRRVLYKISRTKQFAEKVKEELVKYTAEAEKRAVYEDPVAVARAILEQASIKAAETVVGMIEGKELPKNAPPRIILEASKDILDRAGIKPKISIDAEFKRVVDPQELESTKQTLEEIKRMVEHKQTNPYLVSRDDTAETPVEE